MPNEINAAYSISRLIWTAVITAITPQKQRYGKVQIRVPLERANRICEMV
jgi:hypothetical protein